MRLLSHPFRLAGGTVATIDQDSDEATAEGIAVLVLTRKGERTLVPEFGVSDPTFRTLSEAEVNVGIADFGPASEVTGLTITDLGQQPATTATGVRLDLAYTADQEDPDAIA